MKTKPSDSLIMSLSKQKYIRDNRCGPQMVTKIGVWIVKSWCNLFLLKLNFKSHTL